jgi:hypothetical protein
MQYFGIVVHHSVCPSINGKGYDFFITRKGIVIPAMLQTDPNYIHICLEGDFSRSSDPDAGQQEQLFLLNKLRLRLSQTFGFGQDELFPHTRDCPGEGFPWSKLVISLKDGYH